MNMQILLEVISVSEPYKTIWGKAINKKINLNYNLNLNLLKLNYFNYGKIKTSEETI